MGCNLHVNLRVYVFDYQIIFSQLLAINGKIKFFRDLLRGPYTPEIDFWGHYWIFNSRQFRYPKFQSLEKSGENLPSVGTFFSGFSRRWNFI